MNKEFLDLWKKAQQAWLEGCIDAYGKFLNSAEQLLDMTKKHHETLKVKKDSESENK